MTPEKARELELEIARLFGEEWIAEQLSRAEARRRIGSRVGPRSSQEHVVAESVRLARSVATDTPLTMSYIKEDALEPMAVFIEKTGVFSHERAWIEHICERIRSDARFFEKHVAELRVAFGFSKVGYSVLPQIPDPRAKSCDLIVRRGPDSAEVECKAQDLRSPRDAANFHHLSTTVRRLSEVFNSEECPGVRVDVALRRDFVADDPRRFATMLRPLVTDQPSRSLKIDDAVDVTLSRIEPRHIPEIETDESVPLGDSRRLLELVWLVMNRAFQKSSYVQWYVQGRVRCEKKPDGRAFAEVDRPFVFGTESVELPDRTKCVIEHLRSASKQFSGSLPSIVYLEWRPHPPYSDRDDFDAALGLVREELRKYGSISTAVLYRPSSRGGTSRFEALQNPSTRLSLPSGFELARP